MRNNSKSVFVRGVIGNWYSYHELAHIRREVMEDKTRAANLYSVIFSIICLLVSTDVGLANYDTNSDSFNDTMESGIIPELDFADYDPGPGIITYGDTQWTNMDPIIHPIARYYFGMAGDMEEQKVVLFGGLGYVESSGAYQSLGDTWIYDIASNTWTDAEPAVSPPPRYGHQIVYSSGDGVIVLFGGVDPYHTPQIVYNDIWIYSISENIWVEMDLTAPIPARGYNSIAYDSMRDRIIVFGGYNYLTAQWFNDTWTYAIGDSVCVNQNPPSAPHNRNSHITVYNEEGDVVILFGGWYPPNELGDTWIYNPANNDWTQVYPSNSPCERMSFGMTSVGNGALLFGGGRMPPNIYNDTWNYDLSCNEWIDLDPEVSPSARHRVPLASLGNDIVLFGGYSDSGPHCDTWICVPDMTGIEGPLPNINQPLFQRTPNPVMSQALIIYDLPEASAVRLTVLDVAGRLVRTLVNEYQSAGCKELWWDCMDDAGRQVSTGVYFNLIQTADREETQRKVILLP